MAAVATTATVLFTDLVDSTPLMLSLGEAAADDLRAVHFILMREVIARTGGQEVKTIGDAFMVAFGSAAAAVSCAAGMQQAQHRANSRLKTPLAIRIGISAGDVTVEAGDYFGSPVVEAARLCARAEGGQILVADIVRVLAGGRGGHTFQAVGTLELKGLAAPMAAAAVDWRPAADDAAALRNPFVGRERELAAMEASLAQVASGRGGVALVAGEPGIGKTRLSLELAEGARATGWIVLFGRAYESEGMPPYLPWTEALGAYIREIPDARLAAEVGDRAAQLALILPDVARRLPDLPPSPPIDRDSERYRLFESVCDFLDRLARSAGRPGLFLGLEDLHWADASSLLLLEHLGRRLSTAPIFVLANYRDTDLDAGQPLARTIEGLTRLGISERFVLRRLDPGGVTALLSGLSGQEPPARLVEVIYGETEGNPLFVHEVYRYLADEGRLFDEGGHWRSDTRVGEVEIPQGVQLVIGRRLQRVSGGCRRALTFASIIGRVFDFDLLREVSELSVEELLDAMDEAEHAHLVTSGDGHGATQLTFTHELVRQSLASGLSLPRRQALHLRVAGAIERLYPNELEPRFAELALHYSLGATAATAEKAVDYTTRAGRQASAIYAHHEAVQFYEMALESLQRIATGEDTARLELTIELGGALLSAGEPQRAITMAEDAFQLAEELGDHQRASHACRIARLGLLHRGTGVAALGTEFQNWAQRADRSAQPDTLNRGWACVFLADTLMQVGQRLQARRLLGEGFNIALRCEDTDLIYDIATQWCAMGSAPVHEAEVHTVLLEALKRPKVVITETLSRFLIYEGWKHLDWGDADRGWAAWRDLVDLSSRTRAVSIAPFAARTALIGAVIRGELQEAVGLADQFIARSDEAGGPVMGRLWSSNVVFRALLHLGRAPEALARLDEVLQIASLSAVPTTMMHARLATLAATIDSEASRAEMLGLLASHEPGLDRDLWPTSIVLTSLEAVIVLGDRELVSRLAAVVEPAADLALGFNALECPARLLGSAAAFLGHPNEARDWYNSAIEIAGRIAFRPEVALARFQLAELIATSFPHDLAEARDHLAIAIPEFEAMKMAPSLARARALHQRLSS